MKQNDDGTFTVTRLGLWAARVKRIFRRESESDFFIAVDDGEQTLTVFSGKRGGAITLDKRKAELLAEIILNQVRKWR